MQQGLISASDQEINRRKVEILSGITRLRQICDTPALFMDYAGDSGKLDSLRDLLSQIKESDHRVLFFTISWDVRYYRGTFTRVRYFLL